MPLFRRLSVNIAAEASDQEECSITARVTILLNSRSHSTELATPVQKTQSPKVKLDVEKACCRNGTYITAACSASDTAIANHAQ